MTSTDGRNRLADASSPYLLQHKDNPVHWWEWGPDALAQSRLSGKPILLSIGYAACHWCHVMAHESFENPTTAAVMNELFVNIKVDREERPDIDAIYMSALHRMGEQGGWPLTMILDTDARPFFGGTYFPPIPRWGRPSFIQMLEEIGRIWHDEPDKVRHNAEALTAALAVRSKTASVRIPETEIARLTASLASQVDVVEGGLAGAPKFPQWNVFWFLWKGAIRYRDDAARAAVERTLTQMSQGGIYDHIGGGFSRYAVDERWLVPHFEKMLYDNALLVDLMTEVHRETNSPLLAARIDETIAWVLRDMAVPGGGFAASYDADSEGEEGKFYVWSPAEITAVLGADDAREFSAIYDITPAGNFEGHSIPNRLASPTLLGDPDEARLAAMRSLLHAARATRVPPGFDDKVLADWNGLMIAALARAATRFDRPDWLTAATDAFAFVEREMDQGGRLAHAWRNGRVTAAGVATDYANMIRAAIRLLEATDDHQYLDAARRWSTELDRRFWVVDGGGYALSADDADDVIVRITTAHDDAAPSANAIQLANLIALYQLTGEADYAVRAQSTVDAFAADLTRGPIGHCGLLAGYMDLLAPATVAILGGDDKGRATLARTLRSLSLPGAVELVATDAALPPLAALAGKRPDPTTAEAFICAGLTCGLPVSAPAALTENLIQIRTFRQTNTTT